MQTPVTISYTMNLTNIVLTHDKHPVGMLNSQRSAKRTAGCPLSCSAFELFSFLVLPIYCTPITVLTRTWTAQTRMSYLCRWALWPFLSPNPVCATYLPDQIVEAYETLLGTHAHAKTEEDDGLMR